jgi:hypothetical protein
MANSNNSQTVLSRTTLAELVTAASRIARFKLSKPEFGSARNISGVRTKTQTFSQRHDSRTIFASHADYGCERKSGAWTGADKRPIEACRRALKAAGVPSKEVQEVSVISEMGRVAERTADDKFRVHDAMVLNKLACARRKVDGVPVWSSYATIGLTRKGDPGSVEIHWPEIPEVVRKEAKVLQVLVKRGFAAPALPNATVERVQAGIIHSPAIGFFMDISPCIQVVYRGDDPGVGRKPVLYLDRHGTPVSAPRAIEPVESSEKARPKPKPGPVKQ